MSMLVIVDDDLICDTYFELCFESCSRVMVLVSVLMGKNSDERESADAER